MKKVKECRHCGDIFDLLSEAKVKAGGYANECADCVEERGGDNTVAYLGVAAGNGKMSDVTILKFVDNNQRQAYKKAWANNSGQNKGKSCQLGGHLTSMSGMKFEVVAVNIANENHKGKS